MTKLLRHHRRLLCAHIRRVPVIFMLIVIAFSRDVLGQNSEAGAIKGQVTDSWQGSPVPAVIVTVRGTTLGAETDGAGNYLLPGVPAGSHTLILTKNGYERVIIDNVKVVPGITTDANAKLGPIFFELDAFEAITEPIPDQKLEIIQTRQKQSVVMDALGEDYLSQVGAGDAAEAAAKVTGVTIQEGKFVVVRGLSDRYTTASLNGAEIPSADAEKQAAQLDLIPAEMIKRIEVRKTFTPDIPGGFTGGAVNIVTKTFPDRFFFNFSSGMSYNARNNLREDFAGGPESGTDFLAMDDGLRAMPESLQQVIDALAQGGTKTVGAFIVPVNRSLITTIDNPGAAFDNLWTQLVGEPGVARFASIKSDLSAIEDFGPEVSDSGLDRSFSLDFGDNYRILGKESGFLAGINYNRGFTMRDDRRGQRFLPAAGTLIRTKNTISTNGTASASWAVNFATGIRPSPQHEMGFNFSRTQTADDIRSTAFDDVDFDGPTQRYESHYVERTLQNFQLTGRHEFPELADTSFEWTTSIAGVVQDEPNHAQAMFRDHDFNGSFLSQRGTSPETPTRTWRNIEESNFNNRFDFDVPFTLSEQLEGVFSLGAYQSTSHREYREDGFRVGNAQENTQDGTIPGSSITEIVLIDAVDYDGDRAIEAFYGMTEVPLSEHVRLVGGGRVERTFIEVDVRPKNAAKPVTPPIDQIDLLPAIGAVITPSEKLKFTVHYAQTIARPTFREIAPVQITDFSNLEFVEGNPNLKLSSSINFDLRAEYFPQPGEVISAGFFMKEIKNPIEQQQFNSEFANFTFFNTEKANLLGAEFEYRRNLSALSDYLENYTFGMNFAYIHSEVRNSDTVNGLKTALFAQETRPLFDQSPIIANADLTYKNPVSGIESTIAFNYYGKRLVALNITGPDIYEDPVPTLDYSLSKTFGKKKRWKIKFSVKNLLDPTISRSLDDEFHDLVVGDINPFFDSYRRGRSYGLSLSYKF